MVGLAIASVAMVAAALNGKISVVRTNTNHLDAISQLSLVLEDPCADEPQVKLEHPIHNNLGGKGPDPGAEGIVYPATDLQPGQPPQDLLLVVNATNEIETERRANGMYGQYGRITAKSDTHVHTTFRLLNAITREPVIIRELDITFFDLDTHSSGSAVEYVKLKGQQQYFLTKNSQVRATEGGDGYVTFKATRPGTADDNPTDPLLLTVEQKQKAVTVRYVDVHQFVLELGVQGVGGGGYRWFNFVLRPSLLCAKTQGGGDEPDIVTVGETRTTTVAPTASATTTTEEEKKCLFVIPIINFCFPKFF
jgi:hypothetical protein